MNTSAKSPFRPCADETCVFDLYGFTGRREVCQGFCQAITRLANFFEDRLLTEALREPPSRLRVLSKCEDAFVQMFYGGGHYQVPQNGFAEC